MNNHKNDDEGALLKLNDLLTTTKTTATANGVKNNDHDQQETRRLDVGKLKTVIADLELEFNEWLGKLNVNKTANQNEDLLKNCLLKKHSKQPSITQNDTQEYLDCPYDSQHTRILKKNFERHVNACKLKQSRYSAAEIRDFFKHPHVDSPYQIVVNEQIQSRIFDQLPSNDKQQQEQQASGQMNPVDSTLPIPIPFDPSQFGVGERSSRNSRQLRAAKKEPRRDVAMTSNRLFIDYSSRERLALYEYAIEESRKLGFVDFKSSASSSIATPLDEDLEIMDQQSSATTRRDDFAKAAEKSRSRPRSYQTGKAKSHTQVLRELIRSQMDYLISGASSSHGDSDRKTDNDDTVKRHRSTSSSEHRSHKKLK